MKIDKNKLNTLLRSGLNPEIKTRKQLAAKLSLDPTSLTRWFATRDRLGNPRYPVVPDRHVTKILTLFNLSPQSLSLNEEEFRHHCFELSLQYKKGQNELRQKNVKQRKLTIEEYSTTEKRKFPLRTFTVLISLAVAWSFLNDKNALVGKPPSLNINTVVTQSKCWAGFSSSLGDFSQEDEADPCHYSKLFHQALSKLKEKNNNLSQTEPSNESTASANYILFLSKQLEKRRLQQKIVLNVELGKSEFRRSNYLNAQEHLKIANKIMSSINSPFPQLVSEIETLQGQIEMALK